MVVLGKYGNFAKYKYAPRSNEEYSKVMQHNSLKSVINMCIICEEVNLQISHIDSYSVDGGTNDHILDHFKNKHGIEFKTDKEATQLIAFYW